MKTRRRLGLPAVLFVLVTIHDNVNLEGATAAQTPAAGQSGAPTTDELMSRFRRAHAARSIDDLRRLVYWGKANDDTRRSFERLAGADFGKTIEKAVVEPVGPSEVFEYAIKGVTYKPTLLPIGRLKIAFAPSGSARNETTTYLVGESAGVYYLLSAEPVPPRE